MASTTQVPGGRSVDARRGASEAQLASGDARAGELRSSHFLLLLLFAASGCSALIYEIVWYQLLEFVIGATAFSLAILLATFMGGLCIGSIALPRVALARRRHPLRVYAVLELGIGVCGVLVLWGIPLVSRIYVAAVGQGVPAMALRGAICSICLLAPTILMGATLPAVARWIEMTPRGVRWIGLWYGANTAGAVSGCLLAGFYLLRVFDMAVATYAAVAINLGVALVGFGLSLRTPYRPEEVEGGAEEQAPSPAPSAALIWPPYAAIALSGASALGAEVVWTRLLGLVLGPTVYTFSIVLAVFLVGLALGSAAGSAAAPFVRPRRALGYCQLGLVAAIAWTAYMAAKSVPYWPVDPRIVVKPWMTFQIDLVRAIWTILPPTLLWGASFPLAIAAVASHDDDPARPVAGVYASNTLGAILGAIVFSIVLIPGIGTQEAERVLIALSVISALCVLAPRVWFRRDALDPALALAAAVVLAGIVAAAVPAIPGEVIAWGRMLPFSSSQILYAGEGRNSSIAVGERNGIRMFHVAGRVEASSDIRDMRMERMLGVLPALLGGSPRSVLVVGFGAGVTAGSFVVNPDVQHIVICEIEPLVPPTTTRYFGKENHNVLHDPRTEMVYDDARSYVLTTRRKFDVITSDPIHPWIRGSASLYTKEYFELVKQHLNPQGMVAQWVPMYETDLASVKSEMATFFDVFPAATVWVSHDADAGYDLVLLGQAQPAAINIEDLQARLDQPSYAGVAESLREVGLDSAVKFLSTYTGYAPDLKPWLADANINRDGNLRLQYLAGMAVNTGSEREIYNTILNYRRFPSFIMQGSEQDLQGVYNPN